MAKKNRIKKAAGKIKDKLGLGPKVESSSESPAVTIPVKESPVSDKGYVKVGNAEKLSKKYAKIDDVGERAFQILLDLGLTS